MVALSEFAHTGKQIFAEFSEKNVTFMAAGIAYNAFVSLAPLLLLMLFVVSAVGGGLEDRIVEVAQGSLPGPIGDTVAEVFSGDSGAAAGSAVGFVVLLWGTLKIFRGLDTAFSEIYETTDVNSFVDKLIDGVIVLVALLVAIVATVGVTAVFARFSDVIPLVGLLTPVILVAGLLVAFVPMYYRFPDADVDWSHVVPGALFAAVGWAVMQSLFQVYLSVSGGSSGSFFGGVIVIITWLYFSGLVLLLGAVINAVLGGHTSGKSGGVGTGASGYDTTREETLSREEFVEYLHGLRAELTGHDGAPRSAVGNGNPDRYAHPNSDVKVIEQTSRDGDGEWSIAFRWPATDDPEQPSSADD